jgi:integrase
MQLPRHALLYFLFGAQTEIILPNLPDRLRLWDEAFDQWLLAAYTKSPNQMAVHYASWRSFFQFSQMPPWEIQPSDLEAWIDHELNVVGRKNSTTARSLNSLRSFYRFVQAQGFESPPPENPALRLPGPYRGPGSTPYSFSESELAAFLDAIEHTVSVLGKRNYAIVLLILHCGLSAREVRLIRWQDLAIDWANSTGSLSRVNLKSQIQTVLPPSVLEVLHDYLLSSGRLEGIQAADILLPPLTHINPKTQPRAPEYWRPECPINHCSLEHMLKTIAAQAGLQADKVNSRVIRNTAIAHRLQMGDTIEHLQRFLGYSSLVNVYTARSRVASQPQNVLWKNPAPVDPPSRDRQGLYAQALPSEDLALLAKAQPTGLQDEIDALRLTLMRTLRQAQEASTSEQIRLLDSYSAAASRLANLLKAQKELNEVGDHFEQRLEEALRQVQEEKGWELGLKKLEG